MAEFLAFMVLLSRAPFVWIGQQRNRWREWRDVDGRVLAAIRQGHIYGFTIAAATRIGPGRLYPSLARLERDGRVVSRWEVGTSDRPRRRLYAVAPEGRLS